MERPEEIRKIVLIVTQRCNLSCVYCYEHHKSSKDMDFEIAKFIVDSEISKYGKSHFLTIEFFGGEPFMNFKLINSIFEYVNENYSDLHIQFCATTNGTTITPEIEKWLLDKKEVFECALSIDGLSKMHNTNRPYHNGNGSYEDLHISFFTENYVLPRAKMTVSRDTLPYLFEGVRHLEELGFFTVADLAACKDYWIDDDVEILAQQLEKLIVYYSENSESQICRMLDYDLRRIFIDKSEKFQYCGAGKNMVTYDVDGKWYPCMALAPISQGLSAEKFTFEDFSTFELSNNNVCRNCDYLRLCRSCYAANYNLTGSIQEQTHIQCLFNRMTILASAKIQYNRLSKKQESNKIFLSEDEKLILKSIWRIQEVAVENSIFL